MMTLNEYDVVALTAEIQAIHKATSQPILLRPGQVGTILMSFDEIAYLVDFADAQGNIATALAVRTVSIAETLALITSASCLLPSASCLLLYLCNGNRSLRKTHATCL